MIAALLSVWFGGTVYRLYELQVVRHVEFELRAREQQRSLVELRGARGSILDVRGRELAVSIKVESAFVDPTEVDDPVGLARKLARVLPVDTAELARALASDREFVWVGRKLEPEVAARVRELALPGVHFLEENQRYYPLGELAAQVLGFVGTDHEGLAGLELSYDSKVAGETVPRSLLRDARRRRLIEPSELDAAAPGADLHLTLDASLQHLAERELERAVLGSAAAAGTVVLLDAQDSAVLALASYPTFDPNRFAAAPKTSWRNRAVSDAYEPGSTFKMVTAAAAIDSLKVHPDDRFDCQLGGITIDGVTIHDHKPFGVLTFRDIVAKSSNVGVIKAALRTGTGQLYRVTNEFGFGRVTGIDLPGEGLGLVRSESGWAGIATAYAAFGHGLSTTPIQLANAFAALANGGSRFTPYLVRALGHGDRLELVRRPPPVPLPLSPATIQSVVRMLETVVLEGTGRAAQIPGYQVAGKTGTAQKSDEHGYSATGRIASFVGFAPSRAPRLVCLVAIDEPKGATGGGQVAAPVFAAIVEEALIYLGVPPAPESWEQRVNVLRLPSTRSMPGLDAVPAGGSG